MQSMTGYGRAEVSRDGREIVLEMKSVNHRFLDLVFRMPKELSFAEDLLRKALNESSFHRGHVEVSLIYRNRREDAVSFWVDTNRLASFQRVISENSSYLSDYSPLSISEALGLSQAFSQMPAPEDTEVIGEMVLEAFSSAVDAMMEMRLREGNHLCKDLLMNLDKVAVLRGEIEERAPLVPMEYRERLTARLAEWQTSGIDPQRVAQEVAIMADKCAIDEELARLESHIVQFRDIANGNTDAGKKLDFLLQEMNREANTIGSKASDIRISQAVVDIKCVLEKLREQVQNVV